MLADLSNARESLQIQLFWHLLYDKNFLKWRIRKVEQISPTNTTAYKSRVSYQFRIPIEFIKESLRGLPTHLPLEHVGISAARDGPLVGQAMGSPELLIGAAVESLIPVAFLRKRSLVGFSMWGPAGREILLPSRQRLSQISKQVVRAALHELDASAIYDSAPLIIEAQSSVAGDELRRLLTRYDRLSRGCEERRRFSVFAGKVLTTELSRLGLAWADIGEHWQKESEVFHRQVARLCATVQGLQHTSLRSAWLSPVLNPLLLVPEYVRMKLRDDPDYSGASPQRKHDAKKAAFGLFLRDAVAYLGALGRTDIEAVLHIYPLLEFFTLYYIVSIQARITSGSEFMVKFEQLLPTPNADRRTTRLKNVWDGLNLCGTQEYEIVLADAQSTHVEVSHQASDLLQDSTQTKVMLGGAVLNASEIFGSVGHASPLVHHYYSSASAEELARIAASRSDVQELRRAHPGRLEAVLRVTYIAETTYMMLMATAISLTVFLVIVYHRTFHPRDVMNSSQPWNLALAPIILSLIGFLARGRSNEPLIAEWSKIVSVLILLGVMWTLFVVGYRMFPFLFTP